MYFDRFLCLSNGVPYSIGPKKKKCGTCSACKSSDCGTCQFCRDKPKFGGPGRKKKCCVKRKCGNLLTTETIDEVRTKNNCVHINLIIMHPPPPNVNNFRAVLYPHPPPQMAL
jgi:hypothetical protein